MADGDFDAPLDTPRENETRTNLIINYLPQGMTDDDFFSLFISCGPIQTAKVARDNITGYSFGYGFVNFQDPEDAANAIQTYNGYQIQNKRLKVSYSRPRTELIKDTNLYVTNLGPNVTEDMLGELFEQYGAIVTKKILVDQRTGASRGTGFVRFARKEDAQEAINNINGTVPFPTSSANPVQVRIAEEHGKQKAEQIKMAFAGEFSSGSSGFRRGANSGGGGGPGFYQENSYNAAPAPEYDYSNNYQYNARGGGDGYRRGGSNNDRGGGGRGHRFNPMGRGGAGIQQRGGFMRY